jgi:hypothetical protein
MLLVLSHFVFARSERPTNSYERTFRKSLANEAVSFTKADRIDSGACFNFGGVVQATLFNEVSYGIAYGI